MMTEQNQSEGHAAGIFGDYTYEAALPTQSNFLPWHRPRKQFVRDLQWIEQINKLYELQGAPTKLTYLGLPGNDLLDLRFFHNAFCAKNNITLKYLGFNSAAAPNNSAHTSLDISVDEVSKLQFIDPSSEVIWDDFCQIGTGKSNAWIKAKNAGPFDVINLDLCDGFGLQPPGSIHGTHYDSLNQLLSLQSRYSNSWLLFITTRTGNGHISPKVLDILKHHYNDRLARCQNFKDFSTEHFSISDSETLDTALETEGGLMTVYISGICNWLLDIAAEQRPPTSVEVKSVMGYQVNSQSTHTDLISVALRFDPHFTAVADRHGLATAEPPQIDCCSLSTKAISRIKKIVDVDKALTEDPELLESMTQDMSDLLELARYDTTSYREWLNEDNND